METEQNKKRKKKEDEEEKKQKKQRKYILLANFYHFLRLVERHRSRESEHRALCGLLSLRLPNPLSLSLLPI